MAANKQVRFGPVALTAVTTTNVLNPPTLTGGVNAGTTNTNTYYLIKHARIYNRTAGALQAAMWLGATGANATGTETIAPGIASAGTLTNGVQVAANSWVEWFGNLRMDVADFLVGGGSAAGCTFEAEGEIGIA
jgi:hypothetical protein